MTEMQRRLLGLILEIEEICRRHGIPYYLSGGSVIGALRHKGFIPWDDDIDILLDSRYWDAFYHAFMEEMPEGRALGCIENNENFPNMIYRYCETTSTVIHKNEIFGDSTAGVVIDIILLDSFPGGDEAWHDHMKTLLLFSDLVNVYYNYALRFDIDIPYEEYLALCREKGRLTVLKQLEEKLKQYESEENCQYYLVRWPGGPNVFPKSMFGTPSYIEFEGLSLPIPERANDFLRDLYGDEWAEVPPPEEQNPHDTIIDYSRGYDEYFREYVTDDAYRRGQKTYHDLKVLLLESREPQSADGMNIRTIEGLKERLILERNIVAGGLDPVSMFEEGRYQELLELFGTLMLKQGSADYLGTEFWAGLTRRYDPVVIDIRNDYFAIMLWLWIYQGRLSKACKVIRAKEIAEGHLSREIAEIKGFADDMRGAISAYYMHEYEKSLGIVKRLLGSAPCPVPNLLKMRIRLERILQTSTVEDEAGWIELGLRCAPDDGEFLKYKADLALKDSGIIAVCEDYYRAYQGTRNGIIWLEIGDLFKEGADLALSHLKELKGSECYERAARIAEMWLTFIPDNEEFQWYLCESLLKCSDDERREEGRIRLNQYVKRAPENEGLKDLLRWTLQEEGISAGCIDFEIRFLLETDYDQHVALKAELQDVECDRDLCWLDLLIRVCRQIGDKRGEYSLIRDYLESGGRSNALLASVAADRRKMLNAIKKEKANGYRKLLIEEWSMKYRDMPRIADILVEEEIMTEEEREDERLEIGLLMVDESGFIGDYESSVSGVMKE